MAGVFTVLTEAERLMNRVPWEFSFRAKIGWGQKGASWSPTSSQNLKAQRGSGNKYHLCFGHGSMSNPGCIVSHFIYKASSETFDHPGKLAGLASPVLFYIKELRLRKGS